MSDPVLVFDDDCGFCTYWAEFFEERADLPIVGFSELDDHEELRERLPEAYEDCSHLVTAERVYSCGASMEEAFRRSDIGRPLNPVIEELREFEAYNDLREWGYRWAANNRSLLGNVTSKTPPVRRDGRNGTTPKRDQ
jgi:predicted DCC family thiol-disulfide oxidoreductase YuxK